MTGFGKPDRLKSTYFVEKLAVEVNPG